MNRRFTLLMALIIILAGTLGVAFNVQRVEASGTIYINADGSIDPPTANITSTDNVTYYFTSDIYDEIVVGKGNIMIDGNGNTLQGPGGLNFLNGISLSGMNKVTIKNMEIRGFYHGIRLEMSSNENSLYGNNVTDNYSGISLEQSHNNTIAENNITNNTYGGIWLWDSSNNTIVGNNLTHCEFGVYLSGSSNNLLRNNSMSNNHYNFQVSANYVNDVDTSNTVNGKPVYYWVNKRDMTVPLDTGYIALINCTHITVKNLSLTNNGQGLLLANTNNTKIVNNNVTNNFYGIQLTRSYNNTIFGNSIRNNGVGATLSSNNTIAENNITNSLACGIILDMSSNNIIISRNSITNSQLGIQLLASSNNTISGNTIADNRYGIQLNSGENLGYSSNNTIYHNNFVGNTQQVWVVEVGEIPPSAYTNFLDDGYPSGGNYWSDYANVDVKSGSYQNETGSDGTGDTPHDIDASHSDDFPLMGPISFFSAGTWGEVTYFVYTVSNSTVSDFMFSQAARMIGFNVTAPDDTAGFCRVTIPRELLWCDTPDQWQIWVNNTLIEDKKLLEDTEDTYIYFNYNHSTKEVEIQGIYVIPEFPSLLTLPLFTIATLAVATLHRRKHQPKK